MAFQQNGYALVPEAITYDQWRGYLLTHGVNVDWSWGNQCWDCCALLWYQYGLRLQTGPIGAAFQCWTVSRDVNARPPFIQITRPEDVKRGDCVVFNRVGSYWTGHIAFADEDYHGQGYLKCVGQNQGQGIGSGTPSIVASNSMAQFLGAFRNTKWQHAPEPEPTPEAPKQKRFPWVLYSRKLRQHR